ncbi:Lysine-specific demethylase JMJ28 [Linum grandiflorum]
MPGMKLCEIHHLQGKHRQNRWKVPETLKIQREYNDVKGRFRAQNGEVKLGKNKKRKKLEKKKMKRIKAKKNALQFELIRMVLQREGEKRNKNKKKKTDSDTDKSEEEEEEDEDDEEELMQDLPNGFMAISPAKHFNNVGSCSVSTTSCEVKIGADFSPRRRFRSKNIEPLPIGALQEVSNKERQVNKVLYFHYMICMLLPMLKKMNKDLAAETKMEAKIKADFHRSCQSCSYNLCLSCSRDVFQRSIHRNGEDSHDNLLYCPSVLDINGDNLEHFQKHWGKGQPVKVRNVLLGTSDLSWDPIVMFCTYLKNNTGAPVDAKGCSDYFEVEIGVRQVFMGSVRAPKNANMWHEGLKLKGWLSSHVIQEHLPAHYAEILHALPLPEYMDPTSGLLNVAAELPQEILKPDLGPCIYISYNSGENNIQADSLSKLRYDTYDMVNILVHAADARVSTEQLNYIRKLMKKNSENNRGNGVRPNSDSDSDTNTDTDSDTDTDTDSEISKFFISHVKGSRTSEHLRMETDPVTEEKHDESCGAIWDVFRRQDVPKLVEYLRQQCNKLTDAYGSRKQQVTHPLHDQIFFLDAVHKRKLKEEFEIEPWTFEQHVGEAVVVPAGCPYQIRNLKSCVNVVLDFVSPESVTHSIQLIDDLRLLPDSHKAKVDCLEVKKMALHGVSSAIKEIRKLTSSTE